MDLAMDTCLTAGPPSHHLHIALTAHARESTLRVYFFSPLTMKVNRRPRREKNNDPNSSGLDNELVPGELKPGLK